MNLLRRTIAVGALALSLPVVPTVSFGADTFPSAPVKLVVPFSPGGTNDILARLLQEPMARSLGQSVVVENKPGAGGAIGARQVAQSKDGYSVLFTNSSLITTALIQNSAGYDPMVDLRPVVKVSSTPLLLMANPKVPFTDMAGLISYAKAHPGAMEYAVAGPGSFAHLAIESLSQAAGIQLLRVIYSGGAQTTAAVLSGEVKLQLTTPTDTISQFIRNGQIRAIAVSSPGPSPIAPGVPPIADTVHGYAAEAWFGMLVSSATPPEVVNRLNAAVNAALADPLVRNKIRELGMVVDGGKAQELGVTLRVDRDSFQKVVNSPGFKLE